MGEGIKLSVIHRKCNKKAIIVYGGGDKSYYCDYCKEWISDPEREILREKEVKKCEKK